MYVVVTRAIFEALTTTSSKLISDSWPVNRWPAGKPPADRCKSILKFLQDKEVDEIESLCHELKAVRFIPVRPGVCCRKVNLLTIL